MAKNKGQNSKSEKNDSGFKSIPVKDLVSLGKETLKAAKTAGEYICEKERTRQAEIDANVKIRMSDNKLAEARLKRESEHERNYTAFVKVISEYRNERLGFRKEGLLELIKTYTAALALNDTDPEFRTHCLARLMKLEEYINEIDNEDMKLTAAAWLESERRRLS